MHRRRIVALDEMRHVPVAAEERFEFVAGDARQYRGPGNLVAVQMQNGQHGAVVHRIEKLVRVPAGRERAGLGLAVADDTRDEQVGIVECRADMRAKARTPTRRPRESNPASPARHDSGCRRGTRTG